MESVTYEDCGVLGGRTGFPSGTSYYLTEGTPRDLGMALLWDMKERSERKEYLYAYKRLAVCFLNADGTLSFFYTDETDFEEGTVSCRMDVCGPNGAYDYREVGTFLFSMDIQFYEILQQTEENVYTVIHRKAPPDKEKYGPAYDVFRCLDIRGVCNARISERCPGFHYYVRYELGEDFYIEAYDNAVTGRREYWLGREFMGDKHLLGTFRPDESARGCLLDEKGRLLVFPDVAEMICSLTIREEYIYISNEYDLSMLGLKPKNGEEG